MKYLLDVNVLVAVIRKDHIHHQTAFDFLDGEEIALCPVAQLGFLCVSTQPKGINLMMADARHGLDRFRTERKATLIPDDLDPLDSHPKTSSQVPDHYLAGLASEHGLKLATFDARIKHPAVELIV